MEKLLKTLFTFIVVLIFIAIITFKLCQIILGDGTHSI